MRCLFNVPCALAAALCSCRPSETGQVIRAPEWQVEERLTLGVEAGDPAFEFGRIMNVVKLANGSIAVADYQNAEVRVFTSDGQPKGRLGRRGGGPGEFTALTRLTLSPGDRLVAGSNARLATFTTEGHVVFDRRFDWSAFSRPPYSAESARALANGSFVLTLVESSAGRPLEQALHRPRDVVLVVSSDQVLVDSLGQFHGVEQLSYRIGSEVRTVLPLFPASTRLATAWDYVLVGDMASDSVLFYDAATASRHWVSLPLSQRAIPDAEHAAARSRACQWTPSIEERRSCDLDLQQLPVQSEYPVFRDLAVDSLGLVWVGTYLPSTASGMARWLVLDRTGRAAGTVTLPGSMRLAQIGESYLLGVTRDSLGVERVHEYRLTR